MDSKRDDDMSSAIAVELYGNANHSVSIERFLSAHSTAIVWAVKESIPVSASQMW